MHSSDSCARSLHVFIFSRFIIMFVVVVSFLSLHGLVS